MKTFLYWVKEIVIGFILVSMILLSAAIGTIILLHNM